MASNRWKYATMGLSGLIGAGIIFYMTVFIIPFLTASTNNQPNTLEGVPDEWAVHTWTDGWQEAKYDSRVADCDLDIAKDGHSDHQVNLTVSLSCGGDEQGMTSGVSLGNNAGGDEHTFVTEPADFEFSQSWTGFCYLSFDYGSDRREAGVVEETSIHIHCRERE